MLRTLALVLVLAAGGCAPPPGREPPLPDAVNRPSAQDPLGQAVAALEADAVRTLGPGGMAEVEAADRSIVVRFAPSLPRMIRRPDGGWEPEPPTVAAAIRTDRGWIRLTAGGRHNLDAVAGSELDRLFAAPDLWTEPALREAGCTDPAGLVVRVRSGARETASLHPCGLAGPTGQMAGIVLSGRIADWSAVPDQNRPAGLPLERFADPTPSYYRVSSGIDEERRLDIRTPDAWRAQWRRLTARHGPPAPPPPVDFSRRMVLLATLGQRPTGGYQVVIDRVIEQPDALVAIVTHISPGPRCGTTAAPTQPADVVLVPASPKPVRWVVEDRISDCP